MLSQRAIVESKQPNKHADLNLSILSSPPSASDKTVESAPLSDYSQSETLDFGEKLEQEQKASQAADDLEKALEERKRIERNTKLARALIDEFSQSKPTPESLGKRIERGGDGVCRVESKKRAETLLDSVEVSINSVRNGPEYSVRGLKAFDDVNPNYFSFAEFGIVANEDDKTVNIGIGIPSSLPIKWSWVVSTHSMTKKSIPITERIDWCRVNQCTVSAQCQSLLRIE